MSSSSKVIQVLVRQKSRPKKDGTDNFRWIATSIYTVGGEGEAILSKLNELSTATKRWRIVAMPHYETLEDYSTQVIDAEHQQNLATANKKLSKLSVAERAALAAELGVQLPPPNNDSTDGDEDAVNKAA